MKRILSFLNDMSIKNNRAGNLLSFSRWPGQLPANNSHSRSLLFQANLDVPVVRAFVPGLEFMAILDRFSNFSKRQFRKGGIHFAPPSAILPVWERKHPCTPLVELTTLALWKNFSRFFRTIQPANIIGNGCAGLNNLYVRHELFTENSGGAK
jgi:hypothetical protein